ncbi:MAG: NUDIX hydrolase [Ignavibacteria bacterium]|nr:NUDIX hydrolase [Ignavibacteria bacterium]
MSLKEWKHKSTVVKFANPWWEYRLDECYIPNGKQYEYHFVHTGGSAMIIPVTETGKLILVKQYRYLNRKFSIEFPSGGIKDGQNPDDIARKELIEETGFDGILEKIGYFNPYNGITDEYCHVYIARNLTESEKETKDEQEEFEYYFLSPQEVESMIKSNEIHDGMTMAAWSIARDTFLK